MYKKSYNIVWLFQIFVLSLCHQKIKYNIIMDNQEVAKEILRQLGGQRFIVMTGVKNLSSSPSSLTMKLPRCGTKAQWLRIVLNSKDLYDLEFVRLTKTYEREVVKEYNDIYCDQLQEIFTQETKLYTSL